MAWANRAESVRFDVMRWLFAGGLDIGCGASKIMPHFVGTDSGIYYPGEPVPTAECERAELLVSNLDALPIFTNEAWENVFSSHLLDCVEFPRKSLCDWWRLVRRGGHMVLHLQQLAAPKPFRSCRRHKDLTREKIVALMLGNCIDWDLIHNELREDGTLLMVFRKLPEGKGIRQSWALKDERPTIGIMRPGAHGDALWAASVAYGYKKRGYRVTMYQSFPGAEVVRHDPHIDEIIELSQHWMDDRSWERYWAYEAKKYTKFVNLIWSVETMLLPHPTASTFFWPDAVRHQHMNRSYMESTHEIADLPYEDINPRFYPTEQERHWAMQYRDKHGPLVLIAPSGSNEVKTWPHVQRLLDLCAEHKLHAVVLGDVRANLTIREGWGEVVATGWPIRLAMTLATLADVVVGTETALTNAAAMEDNLKVIVLGHSSAENLTKYWRNTIALEPQVPCHPCHRIHDGFKYCHKDERTGWARCQSWASADMVFELIAQHLVREKRAA